jgi:serine/threonine-protein kinase
VFDFGKTEHDAPFIAMELLHGEDLATALERRGSLSERRAVQTILPVIHAMAAAHDKGIVHRDLKPANIFLSRTDGGGLQPKLLDFGVAKLDRDDFKRLTRDGALLGSPAYMSPEQAQGEDVDRSADLWAMCVVLYEMITGNLPFNGDNYNRLLWSIAQDNPAPTSTQFGGDPKLWAILERGFQKRRAMRWESMQDLGEELARWLHNTGCREDIAGVSLQTTWLDRKMSGTDLLASDSELPPSQPALARQRSADLIDTLPRSDSRSDTHEPEPSWRTLPRWLLAVAAVVLLTVPLGAFLLLRGADNEELAPEAVTPEVAEIPTLTTAAVPAKEPVVTKGPPEEPELEESVPMASASAAPEQSAMQSAPPRRPRLAPRRPSPRGRLKNPFD